MPTKANDYRRFSLDGYSAAAEAERWIGTISDMTRDLCIHEIESVILPLVERRARIANELGITLIANEYEEFAVTIRNFITTDNINRALGT